MWDFVSENENTIVLWKFFFWFFFEGDVEGSEVAVIVIVRILLVFVSFFIIRNMIVKLLFPI